MLVVLIVGVVGEGGGGGRDREIVVLVVMEVVVVAVVVVVVVVVVEVVYNFVFLVVSVGERSFMVRLVIGSILHCGPIDIFLVLASDPRLV